VAAAAANNRAGLRPGPGAGLVRRGFAGSPAQTHRHSTQQRPKHHRQ
jgi:hypothetical protein